MEEGETELFEGLNYGDEDELLSMCEYNIHRMIKSARLVARGVGLPKNQWIWDTYKTGVEVTFFVDPESTQDPKNVCLWIHFEGDMIVGFQWEREDGDRALKCEDWKAAVAKIKDLLEMGRIEKRKEIAESEEEETLRKSPKIKEEEE